jgi:4-amino-4-deoxy-L-arabinose transferase-like glycosyltransferase
MNFRNNIFKVGLAIWLFSLLTHGMYFYFNQTFSQDQARDLLIAEENIEARRFLLPYGPKASVGDFYLPPFYYYLQTIVHAVSPYPLSMSILITFIESFSPVILYLIFVKWFNQRSAVLVSLFYTISPLALTFSTFMWNPNLIPFFLLVAVYSTIEYVQNKKGKWMILTAVMVMLAFHLHYQSAVVFPFFLAVYGFLLIQRRQDWKYFGLAVLAALSTFSTYFIGELFNSFHNTTQILGYFTGSHATIFEQVSKPMYIYLFIPEFFSRVMFSPHWIGEGINIGRILFLICIPALSAFLFFRILLKKVSKADLVAMILLFYIMSVVLSLRLYKGIKLDYYMSMLFIAPPVIIGLVSFYTERFTKHIFAGLLLIYFLTMGKYYGTKLQVKYDGYADFVSVFEFANKEIGDAKVFFIPYHQDFINLLTYGMAKHAQFKQVEEPKAEYLLQFCDSHRPCDFFQDEYCYSDDTIENAGLRYQLTQQYQPMVKYSHGLFTLLISKKV